MDRTRRALIGGLIAAALPLPRARAAAGGAAGRLYLSSRGGPGGRFAASLFSESGEVIMDTPLPARGHGSAVRPDGAEAIVFARRPGTFAHVLDLGARRVAGALHPKEGRSYAGHGAYSRDGRTLYVMECEGATGEGVIAVHDAAAGFRRTGEFPSGGIGPHQVVLLPDGRTLAVCIGGIRTHPDFPRAKLNIATMDSFLTLIDAPTGRIRETARLAGFDHRLGVRHLDAAGDGRIAVGMQYEGPRSDRVPVAALHRPGRGLAPLETSPEADAALRHYVGSIAFDAAGEWIAASSPRGGSVVLWRAADGAYRGRYGIADVCGVAAAPEPGSFVLTTGNGDILGLDAASLAARPILPRNAGIRWDNHLAAVNPRGGR